MCLPRMNHHVGVLRAVLFAITLLLTLPPVSSAQHSPAAPRCELPASVTRVPELPEASGLAESRRTPGRLWSHNDSGDPVLLALDSNGRVTGRVQVSGATIEDWEAVAVGACPAGSCIYVADIGDNDADRGQITIYRIAEPAAASGSAKIEDVFHATYPDGAHDAESLLVTPDGRLHIVTKGDASPVSLYRFPADLRSGAAMRLERVGEPRDPRPAAENDRITDGAVSPDGRWIALRSKQALTFHRSADLLAGNWREAARVPLASLNEPQGEGVTFGSGSSIYLTGEGGGKQQPGTLARLTCTLISDEDPGR